MRILVATDLSVQSDEALRQANALAGVNDTLGVVHVMPSLQPMSMLFPQQHATDALDAGRLTAQVTDLVKAQVNRTTARPAEIFVDQGVEYAEILRRAEAWTADLVVVGNSGQGGTSHGLGSVAERVVRHAPCRVLVARHHTAQGCVLAATDLSDPSLPAITAGAEEARRRGRPLHIAHAVNFLQMEAFYFASLGTPVTYDPSSLRNPAAEQLGRTLRAAGVTAESKIIDGSASVAVVREAEAIGAELIVVGAHGMSGLRRFLLGSVAEKIVRAASCSVLVVRMAA